jgi:predicted nucleic acid-binding protein
MMRSEESSGAALELFGELLRLLRAGRWKLVLSNTLCAEYEEVLKREAPALTYAPEEIDRFLDALCAIAERHRLKGPWIPILRDPDDEPQVHLASEAGVRYIVTHNVKHLDPVRELGIAVLTPKEFLKIVREQA